MDAVERAHKVLDRFEKKYATPQSKEWKITGFPAALIWWGFLLIQVLGIWKFFELFEKVL